MMLIVVTVLIFQIEDVSTVPPPEKMKDIVESGGGRWVQSAQVRYLNLFSELLARNVRSFRPDHRVVARLPPWRSSLFLW